jgi:protein-disulfide isomerase
MIRKPSLLALFLSVAVLLPSFAHAELQRSDVEAIVKEYLTVHPEVVQGALKEYLRNNPDALRDLLADLAKSRPSTAAPARPAAQESGVAAAIRANAEQLFNSSHQVVLGNPLGDLTLVEFFDYNCGYCKRALGDTMALLQEDRRLRVVLKEFPILGPRSVDAARVSVAVRMQDPTGRKYLDFHRRLLGASGPASKAAALAIAGDIGLDVAQIERDLTSDEVRLTLEESANLARSLGIRGTPGYIIGSTILPGAIGLAALKNRIEAARTAGRSNN